MERIRVAIVGFGKLGRACAEQLRIRTSEFELVEIFGRSTDESRGTQSIDELIKYKDKIDVVLVCVGSKKDALLVVPKVAANFNTVDSFDTHNKMTEYIETIKAARGTSGVSVVATGWDPGLMSVIRMYFGASLTEKPAESFWGPGVSMGHTNALRQIEGVQDAIQFTVPIKKVIKKAKKSIQIQANKKHRRVCFVVADKISHARIKNEIINMPDYFANQDVKVNFISKAAYEKKFKNRNEHAGAVIAADESSMAFFKLTLKNNARFTAAVMISYAIANYNLQKEGRVGVFTVADIAPKYLFRRDILDLV